MPKKRTPPIEALPMPYLLAWNDNGKLHLPLTKYRTKEDGIAAARALVPPGMNVYESRINCGFWVGSIDEGEWAVAIYPATNMLPPEFYR